LSEAPRRISRIDVRSAAFSGGDAPLLRSRTYSLHSRDSGILARMKIIRKIGRPPNNSAARQD
jgi:hypothetical protein